MRLSKVNSGFLVIIQFVYLGQIKCEFNETTTASLANKQSTINFSAGENFTTVENLSNISESSTSTSAVKGNENTVSPTDTEQSTSTITTSHFEPNSTTIERNESTNPIIQLTGQAQDFETSTAGSSRATGLESTIIPNITASRISTSAVKRNENTVSPTDSDQSTSTVTTSHFEPNSSTMTRNESASPNTEFNGQGRYFQTTSTGKSRATGLDNRSISKITAKSSAKVKRETRATSIVSPITLGQQSSTTLPQTYTTKKNVKQTKSTKGTISFVAQNNETVTRPGHDITRKFSDTSIAAVNSSTITTAAIDKEAWNLNTPADLKPSNSVAYLNGSTTGSSSTNPQDTSHLRSDAAMSAAALMKASETDAVTPSILTQLTQTSSKQSNPGSSPTSSLSYVSLDTLASKSTWPGSITEIMTEALRTTTAKICKNGDYDFKFHIADVQLSEVKFEWNHPTCSAKEQPIKSYDLIIQGPVDTYRYVYSSETTVTTVSNGSSTASTNLSTSFVPCAKYYCKLIAKSENDILAEAWQNFTIPLVLNNPFQSHGKIREEIGPGWVSLSWDIGRTWGSEYNDGLVGDNQRLMSLKLEISGGRGMVEPRILSLPIECDYWDSSQSRITFNITNTDDTLSRGWKWAPCSNYNLKLTALLHDRLENRTTEQPIAELNIRTLAENLTRDAKVENLTLTGKESNWLLRWKRPSCLPQAPILYTVLVKSSISFTTCQTLTSNDVQREIDDNGAYYDTYNLRSCKEPLKPCSTYVIRVRGEYDLQNVTGTNRRSNDVHVETGLPSMPDIEVQTTSPHYRTLSWSKVEDCPKYPLVKYNLTVKNNSTAITYSHEIYTTSCNQTDVPEGKHKCVKVIDVSPCTSYEFELVPVFTNYTDKVTPTVVFHTVGFPDIGEDYNMTAEEWGSDWAMLHFKLHPQCLRYVQNLRIILIDEDSARATSETFDTSFLNQTENGTVFLNLTKSSYFPGFHGFHPCSARYTVKLLPILQNYKSNSEINTSIQVTRKIPSIPFAHITKRGSDWVNLIWGAPNCVTNLLAYIVSFGDGIKNCSTTIPSSLTEINISSSVPCSNSADVMEIKPCTEYRFQVKPQFRLSFLKNNVTVTSSNVVHTLPDPNQNSIRSLKQYAVNSTHVRFTWEPRLCSHYLKTYQLDFQDNYGEHFSAVISPSCLTNISELFWPPARSPSNCQIFTTAERNTIQLLPCTNYTLRLWPQMAEDKEIISSLYEQTIEFSTKPAKPGLVTALNVTDSTASTLTVSWGDVAENARCASKYEVTLRAENGSLVANITDSRSHVFDNLVPCSTYSVGIKNIGENEANESVEIIALTKEIDPGQPNHVEFSHVGPTSVNLTWEKPLNASRCQYDYSVELFQVLSIGNKSSLGKRTTLETHMYYSDLVPETKYEFYVEPFTKTREYVNSRATANITTGRIHNIPFARITDRGSNWIFLVWGAPDLPNELLSREGYLVCIGDGERNCCMTISSAFLNKNLSSSVNCSDANEEMEIRPCTEYHFQVKPQFQNPLLNDKMDFTLSNRIRTLPEPTENYIQNLQFSYSESTNLRITWDPPVCSHYLEDYRLDFQDNYHDSFSVLISPSCLSSNHELRWPPDRHLSNCEVFTIREGNNIQLEACTEYTLQLRPRMKEVNEHRISGNPQTITFETNSAKPGTVTSLKVIHSTANMLSIAWGNVTENARCLTTYNVSLREENGDPFAFSENQQHHVFDNLKPCTTYSIEVIGVAMGIKGDPVKINVSTKDPDYIPPSQIKFSYVSSTAVNLTWEKLTIFSRCHYLNGVEIYEMRSMGGKLAPEKRNTRDTHMYFANLKPETRYGVCVRPLRESGRNEEFCEHFKSSPADVNYMAFAFYILVAIVCTTAVTSLIAWCCVKQPYRVCYLRAKSQLEQKVTENGNSAQHNHVVSNYRMRNMTTHRPIKIEHLEDVLNEFTEELSTKLEEEYKDLKPLSKEDQPKVFATKPENKAKNRYINILPYDHSRVQLSRVEGDENGEYINASFIQGFNGAREYIAAQGPKPNTLDDYWRMLWEQDVDMLVMLTLVEEKEKIKCAQYWPELGQTISYGNITVTHVLQVNMGDYVIRDLDVEYDEQKRTIKQMHFLTWPDFGCPENPETLVAFVEAVRDRVPPGSTKQPILVHCSAGVGRTGTFIVVDWLMQEARISDRVDVFNTVLKIRYDRVNMVQTEDQYFFIHQCLSHFFKTRLHARSSSLSGAGLKVPDLPKRNHTPRSSRGTLNESQVNLTAVTVESD